MFLRQIMITLCNWENDALQKCIIKFVKRLSSQTCLSKSTEKQLTELLEIE